MTSKIVQHISTRLRRGDNSPHNILVCLSYRVSRVLASSKKILDYKLMTWNSLMWKPQGPEQRRKTIEMVNRKFVREKWFKCLGAIDIESDKEGLDIKAKVTADNKCCFTVQKLLHFRTLFRRAILLIFKIIIRAAITRQVKLHCCPLIMNELWMCGRGKYFVERVSKGDRYRIRKNDELREACTKNLNSWISTKKN